MTHSLGGDQSCSSRNSVTGYFGTSSLNRSALVEVRAMICEQLSAPLAYNQLCNLSNAVSSGTLPDLVRINGGPNEPLDYRLITNRPTIGGLTSLITALNYRSSLWRYRVAMARVIFQMSRVIFVHYMSPLDFVERQFYRAAILHQTQRMTRAPSIKQISAYLQVNSV